MLTREKIREKYLEKIRKYKGESFYIEVTRENPNLLRVRERRAKELIEIISLLEKADKFFCKIEKYTSYVGIHSITFEITGIDYDDGVISYGVTAGYKTISEIKEKVLELKKEIERWIDYWEEPICGSCPYAEILEWEKEKK